jgi:hypothetical protein
MTIKINIIEAASELAATELNENWQYSIRIYEEIDETETIYTEEAQEIFDNLYDKYYDFLYNLQETVSFVIG